MSSSSSCGTQQSPEGLQCQPQHYHCYHQSSQAQQPPEKNVVYERVRTYSGPMNKVVEALGPIGSREVCSSLKTASSYQSLLWSDRSQVPQRQLCQKGEIFVAFICFWTSFLFFLLLWLCSTGYYLLDCSYICNVWSPKFHLLAVLSFTSSRSHLFISSSDFHNLTRA